MDDKLNKIDETPVEKKLAKPTGKVLGAQKTVPAKPSGKVEPKIPRAGQAERWKSLHSHLDQALNQFNDITEALPAELSPDKKRLQEVKQLLTQLKVKLEEF